MTPGFWKKLPKPFTGLAPMDGVTDAAFRYIVAKYGRPDLIITEFTAAEGIRAGALRLLDDFYYDPLERPIVAQLFGSDPEAFFIGAFVASALGFDGIDINMGCPAKNVTERGAGAALILNPPLAKAIVAATKAGNAAWANGMSLSEARVPENLTSYIEASRERLNLSEERTLLPVSIKTRIGVKDIVIKEWVQHLLETEPVAITIHGRTLKQLYSGYADWEAIGSVSEIIHTTPTLLVGNGDIQSTEDARSKCAQYGVDGILIGRASFGNPWIFQSESAELQKRLEVALEHAEYLDRVLEGRGFLRIRKHLLDYTRNFPGAKELRSKLMSTRTLEEIQNILQPVVSERSF